MAYENKKKTEILTDDSLMPSGKYKGDKMIDVPAIYFMYIYDNGMCRAEVHEYIKDNYNVILEQAKKDGYASKE